MAKEEGREQEVQDVCTVAINIFRQLMVYLAPVLPELTDNAKAFLNIDDLSFASRHELLLSHKINKFKPLMQRIEQSQIDAMIEESKQDLEATPTMVPADSKQTSADNAQQENVEALDSYIEFDDFMKVEMTVAQVLECNHVEGADKLLQFTLDIGKDQPINVFSGIRKFYEPEQLANKKVICVTNLAPRKMKFGVSEGMILSSGDPKTGLVVITLPDECKVGDKLA